VEWSAHAPLAKKAGLADSIIADLKANKRWLESGGGGRL
jgi:hypothetical protein